MQFKTPILISTIVLMGLTACVDPNAYPDNPNARATNGAVMGGILGAVAGASQKGDDKLAKAVIGGALGAAVGGAIGATLDQQAADLRGSLGNQNISVTNNGEYLVVNMPQDLLFATGSAALRPDLTRDLRAIAANLIRYPNSQIEVVGHTDNTASAALNQDLSQRRAVSVANVLRDSGVPNGRISAYGRGEDQPIASNLSEAGRAQNRRVEIFIRPTR
jgi:outer membrane protein OmpA-like peptidoglycan-associated protein